MRLSVSRLAVVLFRRRPPTPVPSNPRRPNARSRARLAVGILPFAFVGVLFGAWVGAEAAAPAITDPEYHVRLRVARAAVAEHPHRPLGVVLGSSRTVWAFRPEQLTEPDGVYWVNGAHVGAGPVLNRLMLHRLLRDGVRPAVVVLEVMPPFFAKENERFVSGHFAAAEMPLMRRYANDRFGFDYHFLRHRLIRAPDLARVPDPLDGHNHFSPRGGHRIVPHEVTPDERARRTAIAYQKNAPALKGMAVRPAADRALRDTLREAAENGVRVVLLRSPEGPVFRSWYDPAGLARFDAYTAGVAKEFGVPVLDARLWLDEEDFYDSHHVLKRGADKFTARFAREIPPLLRP